MIDWWGLLRGAIEFFFDSLAYWTRTLSKAIHNALISFINWIYGGIEYIYNNLFRPYLINILTLWFTFFGEKHIIRSGRMSLRNKIISVVATPFLSYIASCIIASLVPMEITLPRIEPLPEDIEYDGVVLHEPLVEDMTEIYSRIEETFIHDQVIVDETYIVIPFAEDLIQTQVIDEYVDIYYPRVEAYEDLIQTYQRVEEQVVIMTIVTFYEDMSHEQVTEEEVIIQ